MTWRFWSRTKLTKFERGEKRASVSYASVLVSRRTASAGLRAEVVDVQVAIERNQQMAAVGREAVLHDSRIRRGALPLAPRFFFRRQRAVRAGERARIHQQAIARLRARRMPTGRSDPCRRRGRAGRRPACHRARSSRRAELGPERSGAANRRSSVSFSGLRGCRGLPVVRALTATNAAPSRGKYTARRKGARGAVCYTADSNSFGEFRDGSTILATGSRLPRAH